MRIYIILILVFAICTFQSCKNEYKNESSKYTPSINSENNQESKPKIIELQAKVVKTYPHDNQAYTQGLLIHNGELYESTGLNKKSSLRIVDLETGNVLKKINLNDEYFAEGITVMNNKIYLLTWTSHICMVYDINTFKEVKTFKYPGEGWGITSMDSIIVMSDGSNVLRFINPNDFSIIKTLPVTDDFYNPIPYLNELEFINGEIWANVWTTDFVVQIDPNTGIVKSRIDLSSLRKYFQPTGNMDVLNGIAYNKDNNKIYVTGKNWPLLFEIIVEAK